MTVVLVVEDSAVTRAVVRETLAATDATVHEAADGALAIAMLARAEVVPDVVLCDVEMPEVDGFGVLAWIRAQPEPLRSTPVVFLTGLTDASDVAEGLRRGADDYLRKPFEAVELLARVRVAARTKELQDELRARNAELEDLVATDPLTRVRNRRHLALELARLAQRSRRHGVGLGVLLIDVDHFKAVNDTHGHAVGDAVLVEIAGRLARTVRAEDAVGRWGGEEFLVLAADANPAEIGVLAERLRAEIARTPVDVEGTPVTVTASIGHTAWREGDDADTLLARADVALYAAKDAGRNVVRAG